MDEAERQASRDGAVLVNSMHQFFKAARPYMDPPPQHTAHVSITCDMRTAIAWIHWRQVDGEGNITYEMERLAQSFCNDTGSMQRIRAVIKNRIDHALGPRLDLIRETVETIRGKFDIEDVVPHAGQMSPPQALATPAVSSTLLSRKRTRVDDASSA